MKLKFDLWVLNKRTDTQILVKNNTIDTKSLRVSYNKNAKNLRGEDKTLFNSFKRQFNTKPFNLILSDGTKKPTSSKELGIEALLNNKSEMFDESNKIYAVYPYNQFEKRYGVNGLLGVRIFE